MFQAHYLLIPRENQEKLVIQIWTDGRQFKFFLLDDCSYIDDCLHQTNPPPIFCLNTGVGVHLNSNGVFYVLTSKVEQIYQYNLSNDKICYSKLGLKLNRL